MRDVTGRHLEVADAPDVEAGEITYLEAVRRALADALRDDERVFVMGEDIGAYGGAFGVTKGLFEEFGASRVMDTPISEEGFVGAAIGAAWMGERPIVELQFADFLSCAFDSIVSVAAKTHWRTGQEIPIVLRLPTGGGVRGGPYHSASPEGWVVGEPGLKVVCPGTVADAYGLLRSAIDDPDPVLFFEHKALYRRLKGAAPAVGTRTPLGRAQVVRPGEDLTVVTYGSGVTTALAATERSGADVEVLDLRTLWPLDEESVLASIAKTSRVLVLQEAARSRGVAGLVLSLVACKAFELLDAPPLLHAPPDAPVPFAPELEDGFLPSPRPPRPRSGISSPTDAMSSAVNLSDVIPCSDVRSVPREARLALLRLVLLQRLFEERAMALYRQGRIAGSLYDGRGQEAVAASAGLALAADDVVCPLNRELATHFAKGVTVAEAFRNFLGKGDSPTRGRDGNMHFGVPRRGVFPLVSMLGDLVPVTVGAALAFKRRGEPRVALTFIGRGDVQRRRHARGAQPRERLAGPGGVRAAAKPLRILDADTTREMVNTRMAERMYGGWSIPCETVDGTDAVETFDAIAAAVGRARAGLGPQAVEAVTLRIHGHAAHDDARYVPDELRAAYAHRDPVDRLLVRLAIDGVTGEALTALHGDAEREIGDGLAEAELSPAPDPASVTDGVWARPLVRELESE